MTDVLMFVLAADSCDDCLFVGSYAF